MVPKMITLIPGEGIGPEIMKATVDVIRNSGANVDFETAVMDASVGLPVETVATIRKNRIALKGPTATPIGKGARSLNVQLREQFGTFANVRPIRSINGVPSRADNVDIVVIRENLEDLYMGLEAARDSGFAHDIVRAFHHSGIASRVPDADCAIALKVITPYNSLRIARFAFEYARKHGRKKVTCVHKANILKETDGLFLGMFKLVGAEYPDIMQDDLIVDNACMQVVLRPERLDVLLCPNLYGDIISDVCAGMVGGLGFAPGANIGEVVKIFEAVHGTAPDIAGKNIANPTALILSAVMMLNEIGEIEAAARIAVALRRVYSAGVYLTGDVKRNDPVNTTRFANEVIFYMQK